VLPCVTKSKKLLRRFRPNQDPFHYIQVSELSVKGVNQAKCTFAAQSDHRGHLGLLHIFSQSVAKAWVQQVAILDSLGFELGHQMATAWLGNFPTISQLPRQAGDSLN
jgi:hypothetical protein